MMIRAEAIKNPQPGIINCMIMPTPIKKKISPIKRFFLNIKIAPLPMLFVQYMPGPAGWCTT